MCRDNDHGGRRCPHDTSDARRARRYASAAKSRTEGLLESTVRPVPPPAPVEERPEVEVLTERAAELRWVISAAREFEQGNHYATARRQAVDEGLRREEMADRTEEIFRQKLEDSGLAQHIHEGGLVSPAGSLRWDSAEQEVTKLGAATDRWLDGQLLDEMQAVTDADGRYAQARDALTAASAQRGRARDANPAMFLRTDMTEEHQQRAIEHNARRAEILAPTEDSYRDADKESDDALEARAQARQAYYLRKRELLAQIRPMGGQIAWSDGGVKTSKAVGVEIQKAADMLPTDWIAASNGAEPGESSAWSPGLKPMRVRESPRRNHYSSHEYITRRQVFPVRSSIAYLGQTREEYAESLSRNPSKKVIPPDQWTEKERRDVSYDAVVYEECDVAYPGRPFQPTQDPFDDKERKTKLNGYVLVDEDGNLIPTGAAAKGWEKHEYVDRMGEDRIVWRRTRTRVELTKDSGYAELTYPRGAEGSSTTLHELTHRCEDANRSIGRLENAFLLRRVTDEDGEMQEDEAYHSAPEGATANERRWYKKYEKERVRPDSFIDRYIGKDYGSMRFHEVMTVGNEVALFGRMGGFGKVNTDASVNDRSTEGARDDDHHAFVLGTLLAA